MTGVPPTDRPNLSTLSPRARFLAHCAKGELAFQRDPATGRAIFYPRMAAPGSGAEHPPWEVSAGIGTVYSTTCVRSRDGDHNVALIDMEEGFRLLSRVEGIAPDAVRIGQQVRVRMRTDDGEYPYPVFDPVTDCPGTDLRDGAR